jgi:predicted secreted Zn-dependent protease
MRRVQHTRKYIVHFHDKDDSRFDYAITRAFNKRQAFLNVKRMLPKYAIVRPDYVERYEP